MDRAQCDSEFVETAFTTEEVVEVASQEIQGAAAEGCAFLGVADWAPEARGSSQTS